MSEASPAVPLLADRLRRSLLLAGALSNGIGATVTFVFASFVLPLPFDLEEGLVANVVAFVVYMAVAMFIGVRVGRRLNRPLIHWIEQDRPPDAKLRDTALSLPLQAASLSAALWAGATVVFTVVNLVGDSVGPAVAAGAVAALGGLTTVAVQYLIAERALRPAFALVLADGAPQRPVLPGVAARTVLAWAAATGIPLLGVAASAVAALVPSDVSEQRLAISALALALIGLTVGFFAMRAVAASVADPVRSVRDALSEVEAGHVDAEVPVFDGSEVGLLQAGFNRMAAGLRERERLHDLFGRHVGEDVARQALERGISLGGEEREVAVLFVDVVGSTSLAARRPPDEVVAALNDFFAIVVDCVRRRGGLVNKFEGDACLCVFGAPIERRDAADCALAAAREMRARLEADLPDLAAGIGVSAGTVVAGNVGAEERFEYTVIGDPVNEAARLTELAKTRPGRILASQAAVERASDEEAERWSLGEEVTLRGRSDPTRLAAPVAEPAPAAG